MVAEFGSVSLLVVGFEVLAAGLVYLAIERGRGV